MARHHNLYCGCKSFCKDAVRPFICNSESYSTHATSREFIEPTELQGPPQRCRSMLPKLRILDRRRKDAEPRKLQWKRRSRPATLRHAGTEARAELLLCGSMCPSANRLPKRRRTHNWTVYRSRGRVVEYETYGRSVRGSETPG